MGARLSRARAPAGGRHPRPRLDQYRPKLRAGPPAAGELPLPKFLFDSLLARAVLLAVRRGLKVFGRFVAGDRLLEARELDDDEAVEFLRALQDLELAAARQDLAVELLEDAWYQVGVLLVLIGIVDLRARDPIGDHLILHANRERLCPTRVTTHSCCRGSQLSRA